MGKHVIFHIEERKRVKAVDYVPVGEHATLKVDVSKIETALKDHNIEVHLDAFVDEATIQKVITAIRELYAQQGYNDVKVEPVMRELPGGPKLVDLRFNITSGPQLKIRDVVFDGNQALSDGELRKQMKDNQPRSKLLFFLGRGTYHEQRFADDADRIADYYRTHGYWRVEVGQPQVESYETSVDGKSRWIQLRVPIEEGPQYKVGTFVIAGTPSLNAQYLRNMFDIKQGDVFSLKKLRKGFERVKDVYGAYGFYQWAPDPEMTPRDVDPETGKPKEEGGAPVPPIMDINLKMNEGKQFYVNRITFVGNTTTHDAVIRRELNVAEGALFNSEALKMSVRRLNQLGYFKPLEGKEGEMDVTPTANVDNKVDVKIKVEEQNRNQIAFGAGYSQFEGVFGQLSFQTSNFLGRGETLGVSLQRGSQAEQYQLSFSEPYLFDRPINAGFDLHKTQFIYPGQFTQESTGANLVVGFPLANFTRAFMGYSYEAIRVFDVNSAYLSPAALRNNPFLSDSLLIGQNGRRLVSKISPSVVFNTVNAPLFPRTGQKYSAAFDLAGIGGNTSYTQSTLEGTWYFPISTHTALGVHGSGQYIRPYGDTTTLPIFEKIFLGGEYTMRGFDIRSVSPRDPQSGLLIGGNKSLIFNAEYYVDIMGQVRVLAFYDAGEVRDIGERFVTREDITQIVVPPVPLLVDFLGAPNLLTEPGGIRSEVIGHTSAIKTSTGLEVRFMMPVLNIPFRLIAAYNPQRLGVLKNDLTPTPKFTFRFAVGTMF
jgi:outer membrane protein insertion porin family